ncbi:alpha/beta hydrolase [Streptomyces sp. A10(2020)]|uniref:alpha/beta fold hydrolase n=1 Tax=Streptomyces sp. A10(2020) TaxID=2782013 RepID=UPI001F5DCA48|nr:alpha/beta hydrolase [Streptomyces sp. A10(2020)]
METNAQATGAQSGPLVHRTVATPAGRTHLVEQGTGPLVLLVHGFPESWYSWRHQLPALAAAGYRAVAIDVRGYGRSSRPADPAAYRMTELVADCVAVVHALGEGEAVVVGHDWGSRIAADAALTRPDVFRAVALLSVPYEPHGGPRPSGRCFFPPRMGEADDDESSTSSVNFSQQPPAAREAVADDYRSPDVPGRGPPRRWVYACRALLRRHHARARRARPALHQPGRHHAPALPGRAPRLAHRGRPGRLRGRVRTHRNDRRPQPLPEHGPRLGGPRRVRRGADRAALPLPRRRPRRLHHLALRRHRRLPPHPPRAGRLAPA